MTLREFIKENRAELDNCIGRALGQRITPTQRQSSTTKSAGNGC
jgi:hypothetical protein